MLTATTLDGCGDNGSSLGWRGQQGLSVAAPSSSRSGVTIPSAWWRRRWLQLLLMVMAAASNSGDGSRLLQSLVLDGCSLHLFSSTSRISLMGDSYTISISSKLINQLAGEGDKPKKKTKKLKPRVPQEGSKVQNELNLEPNGPSKTAASVGWPQQHPLFVPLPPPPQPTANAELEAIRSLVQESEKAVGRLQKKEAEMVKELTERAKELHEKEFKLPYQRPLPCLDEKNACLECYKEHKNDPLRCAYAVKAFKDCARKARQQMSS